MTETWKSFDERLLVLKLTEPVRQMHEETKSRHRKISFEHSRSGQGPQSLFLKLINSDLTILREYLDVVDRLCREVWIAQGNAITSDFVRAMRDHVIQGTIGGRTGSIGFEIENMATRTGYAHLTPVRQHLALETEQLKVAIANRYEAEALELEYKNAQSVSSFAVAKSRVTLGNVNVTPSEADLWRNFRDEFKSLANEEMAILQRTREDRGLRVHCEYNSDRSASEDKLCRDGLFCLLYRLETGRWDVTEGSNRDFKARFEALSSRAGIQLGSPNGTLPQHFWLHSLSLHLRRTDSNELFARGDTGGIITTTCQSSATFCSQLEKKALEMSASAAPEEAKREVAQGRPETNKTESSAAFICSPDYRSIRFRDVPLSFTSRQAHVIEMLHNAYKEGAPELGKDYILEQLGDHSSRLRDTFKNHEAWKFLIVGGKKRGTYRLDLPDPQPHQ